MYTPDKIMNMSDKEIMLVHENECDDLLEQLYWEFDAEVKKGNKSERDVFKMKMRAYAAKVSDYKDTQIMVLKLIRDKAE